MGEKKHINKIPHKIPGQSRENFVYVFFSLCVFSLPTLAAEMSTKLSGTELESGNAARAFHQP